MHRVTCCCARSYRTAGEVTGAQVKIRSAELSVRLSQPSGRCSGWMNGTWVMDTGSVHRTVPPGCPRNSAEPQPDRVRRSHQSKTGPGPPRLDCSDWVPYDFRSVWTDTNSILFYSLLISGCTNTRKEKFLKVLCVRFILASPTCFQ